MWREGGKGVTESWCHLEARQLRPLSTTLLEQNFASLGLRMVRLAENVRRVG
jgi:hypothetical protein